MAELAKSFPKGLEYRITYNPTEFIEVSIKQALHHHPGGDRAGRAGGAAVPQDLARHAHSGGRHPRVADRHLRGHAGVRLLAQHADPVRAGAGGRHRRRRRHRRGGERRAQAEGGLLAAARRRACPWTRSAPRWSPSRWCCSPCSFPTTFIGGITGQFYRQFAVTIATATAISLFLSLTLSPALCGAAVQAAQRRARPKSSLLMRAGACLLPRCSTAASMRWRDGYARLVRGLSRAWVPVLVVLRLPAGVRRLVRAAPADRLHSEPRPRHPDHLAAAAAGRVAGAHRRGRAAGDRHRADRRPACKYSNAFTGRNAATFTARHQRRPAVPRARRLRGAAPARARPSTRSRRTLRGKLAQIEEAQTLVFIPPPVRGMGAAAGFSMRLQDTLGMPTRPSSRASPRSSWPRPTARPASPTSSPPSRPPRRRCSSTSTATRRRCCKRAGDHHLRGHARVHGLGLRQRLQHVRPHLSRHRAGRRRLPPRPGERVQDPRAQRRRRTWCRSAAW